MSQLNFTTRSTRSSQHYSSRSPLTARAMTTTSAVHDTFSTATHQQSSAESSAKFVEFPSKEEKHRLVFEEMDVEGKRRVTFHNFRRLFEHLDIGFSPATLTDLFQKVLNYQSPSKTTSPFKKAEFQYSDFLNWAERYPLIIDALYFRRFKTQECHARQAAIRSTEHRLQELTIQERNAQEALDACECAIDEQLRAQAAAETERERLLECQRVEEENVAAMAKKVELVLSQQSFHMRSLPVARSSEQASLDSVLEQERAAAAARQRLQQSESVLEENAREEARLKAALEACQEARGRLEIEKEDAAQACSEAVQREEELQAAYSAAKATCFEVNKALEEANNAVHQAQEEAMAVERRVREVTATLKQHEAGAVAMANRSLALLRDERRAKLFHHESCVRWVEEATKQKVVQENDLCAYETAFRASYTTEKALLDEQVRLREQGDNLVVRDAVDEEKSRQGALGAISSRS